MMQWQIPQNNGSEEIDEHDMPTEPISYEVVSPSSPTAFQGASAPYHEAVPTPQPLEQPFPRQYVPVMSPPVAMPPAGGIGVYPVAPPLPPPPVQRQKKGKRSTDAASGGNTALPPGGVQATQASQRGHSSAPALVKLFFVAVRLLLLVQFVVMILQAIFHWPGNALWANIVYVLSPLFIWPVRLLIQQIPLPFSLWPELYVLLAIVFYSVLSRILVWLLKTIKH